MFRAVSGKRPVEVSICVPYTVASMPANPSVTLDTNCIIDLQEDQAIDFRRAMDELLEFASRHQLDLAVTTRVESEAQHPSTIEAYRSLIQNGKLKVVGSTTRLGYWKLGVDVLPDEQLYKSIAKAVFPNRDPETFFRPSSSRAKDFVDVDHLYGHLHSSRNFFVTRDQKIMKARERLAVLGIQVRTPQEMVEEVRKGTRRGT